MILQKTKLILVLILMITIQNDDINVHGALNTTENSLASNLPEGIILPPELKDIDFSELAKNASDSFKQKCFENSGSDAAFEESLQALTTFMECIVNIVDIQQVMDAIPNGILETVLIESCNKRSEGLACVDKFTKSIDPCLTQEEKNQSTALINNAKNFLEFVCHENLSQIALFITEEGPVCFELKKDNLMNCFNKTVEKYFEDEVPALANPPTLVIEEENCDDINNFEECVISELKQCNLGTPANVVGSLFRFVKKDTPCDPIYNSSGSVKLSIGILMVAILTKLVMNQ